MLSANWINPECPYPHSQSTGMALAVCQHSLIINKWITHPYVCGLGGSWGSFPKCEVFMVFLKGLGSWEGETLFGFDSCGRSCDGLHSRLFQL